MEWEVEWQEPNSTCVLQTTPGLLTTQSSLPSGDLVRWGVDFALGNARRGGHIATHEEFESYISAPYLQNAPDFPRRFVIAINSTPAFSKKGIMSRTIQNFFHPEAQWHLSLLKRNSNHFRIL